MSQESMRFPIQPRDVHAAGQSSARTTADMQQLGVARNRARQERDRRRALLERFRGKTE